MRPSGIRIKLFYALLISSVTLPGTSGQARAPAGTLPAAGYLPASVKAAPELQCKLHPSGTAPASGLTVFTDGDGYARFHAVWGTTASESLVLSCVDEAGRPSSYPVDLTSDATFVARPLDIANERGIDRPPLTGDPLSYTQAQLSREGYGLRPDPAADPAAYASWREAATKPGRMLYAKRSDGRTHTVATATAPPWIGSVMTGLAPYKSIQATFEVPTAIPGALGTTSTEASIWPGLGGFPGFGLIQAGVTLRTTPTTASYLTWREYCCGLRDSDKDLQGNHYGGAFVPSPGDKILAQAWYCDANELADIDGGFGCTYLYDFQSGAVFSCTIPLGDPSNPPCWSVPGLPQWTLGASAEFILENQSGQLSPPTDQFPAFTPTLAVSGLALTTRPNTISTVDSDPTVTLLSDYPHGRPHITVALTGAGTTSFTADLLSGQQHIFYRGTDGAINHIFWDAPSNQLSRDQWTAATQEAAAAGDPVAMVWPNQQHVFYRATDGHIHHIWWDDRAGYGHDDWTAATQTRALVLCTRLSSAQKFSSMSIPPRA